VSNTGRIVPVRLSLAKVGRRKNEISAKNGPRPKFLGTETGTRLIVHALPEEMPDGLVRGGYVHAELRALPLSRLDSDLLLIRALAACACLFTSALGSSRIRSKAGIASFALGPARVEIP
jgi:hypothetical protein